MVRAKKILHYMLIIVLFISILYSKTNNEKEGIIKIDAKNFFYSLTNDIINIIDSNGKKVFQKKISNIGFSIYLSTGFLKEENSFYVFKENFKRRYYDLEIVFQNKTKIIIQNSATPFYSPMIVNYYGNNYIAYIDENFSINTIEFDTGRLISKISFKTPIHSLEYFKEKNEIGFFIFKNGSYKKIAIKIEDLFQLNFLRKKQNYYSDKLYLNRNVNYKDFHKDKFSTISLDYYKFLGFGDSITFGYINREEAPDKGYIPRLQDIIDSQWYGGTVINEGVPGEVTEDAVERFESTLLKHKAKYLLFHEGTNDALFPNRYSVSMILFNIEYMIKKAIEYNVTPVLTTIIPRNGKWGEGIYRERSIEISKGIRKFSSENEIKLIDLFDIFLNYPESDGGYSSLMSDTVHPSEKGYQLMAEKWFDALKNIPPDIPKIISYQKKIDLISNIIGIKFNIDSIKDPDFKKFHIYYGEDLNQIENFYGASTNNTFFIVLPPGKKYFIGIKSADQFGNESKLSSTIEYKPYRLFF